MRKRFAIFLCTILFSSFVGEVFSQPMSSSIPLETRALLESQIKALKSYYPIRTAENLSTSPLIQFPLTDNEIEEMIDGLDDKWQVDNIETVIQYVRFFAYTHSNDSRYLLAMAELQQQLSIEAFHKYDVPEELMYLALVKSGMNPKYVSSSGAQGTWQFMYSTARLYHLRIDNYVDERREIHESSEAAAWMLKDLYNMYNDWPLAITAFNCGPGNVNKALKIADTIPDLSAVYEFLPSPERDLYTMFIAIQVVINNTVKFGLEPASINAELINDTVQIDEKLHLGQVADVMGIDKELLVNLNPVYPREIIPGEKGHPLSLILPLGKSVSFLSMKDSIFNYKDSLYFNLKPLIAETEAVKQIPAQYTPGKGYTPLDYTIKSGDNLGYITDWFDTQISEVRYWNGIRGNTIRAGQKLVIYVPDFKKTYYSTIDNLSFQQKQAREGKFISSKAKVLPVEEKLKAGEYTLYTVRSGDNPWQIAKKYPGVSDQDILRWNGISPRDLKPGQKLKIKKISK